LTTTVVAWPPSELHLADEWTRVIDRAELRARLGEVVLLDARGVPRYRGEAEPVDPVAGHIPTALNVPVEGNLVKGRFRSPDELAARFRDLGADGSGGPVVTSCGSGTSALHHAVAMRLAGLPDPILYVGSYSQWSRSAEPVMTGPEPGEPPPPR
jgi:thiosulfate/3-mercaptopyruvate sulfurtransferase